MSRRTLAVGLTMLAASFKETYERLPEWAKLVVIDVGIVISLAIIGGYFYPDARAWALRAWGQTTTAATTFVGMLFIAGWYFYMRLRGREVEAQRALAVVLVITALSAIGTARKSA